MTKPLTDFNNGNYRKAINSCKANMSLIEELESDPDVPDEIPAYLRGKIGHEDEKKRRKQQRR